MPVQSVGALPALPVAPLVPPRGPPEPPPIPPPEVTPIAVDVPPIELVVPAIGAPPFDDVPPVLAGVVPPLLPGPPPIEVRPAVAPVAVFPLEPPLPPGDKEALPPVPPSSADALLPDEPSLPQPMAPSAHAHASAMRWLHLLPLERIRHKVVARAPAHGPFFVSSNVDSDPGTCALEMAHHADEASKVVARQPLSTIPDTRLPVLVLIAPSKATLAVCQEAMRHFAGGSVEVTDVKGATTLVAARKPFAVVLDEDVYAFDPREFQALGRAVGAEVITIPASAARGRLLARLLPELEAAYRRWERRD